MKRCETPEYRTWVAIKGRCYCITHKRYDMYGAKGILMSEEWRNNFDAFLRDMGVRPPDKTSIDRIDGSKGYFHGNCRWANQSEQTRNRKGFNVYMTLNGVTKLQIEWCEELDMPFSLVTQRRRLGWSDDEALTTPSIGLGVHNRRAVIDTATLKVYDAVRYAAEAFGLKEGNLRGMLIGRVKNRTTLVYLENYKPSNNKQLNLL